MTGAFYKADRVTKVYNKMYNKQWSHASKKEREESVFKLLRK